MKKNFVIVGQVPGTAKKRFTPGSIVECVNSREILLVTNNETRPFVDMSNGSIWGDNLDGIQFRLLSEPGCKISITPAPEK